MPGPTRIFLAALVALAATGRAPGQSTIDLARPPYSVRADQDIAPALQRAVDALREAKRAGTILIPAGNFRLVDNVFVDVDRVRVRGAGRNATILNCFGTGGLVFGVPRLIEGQGPGPGHWVDLHGRLDATAAPKAGVRWGLRTRDPRADTWAFGTFPMGPFAFAKPDENWSKVAKLTVDFAVDARPAGLPDGQLFGATTGGGRAQPLYLTVVRRGDVPHFVARFATGPDDESVDRMMTFPGPTDPRGVVRVSIQIDLEKAEAAAWVDGRRVPVDPSRIGLGWEAGRVGTFTPNDLAPFQLGALSLVCWQWMQGEGAKELDRTFCGLRYVEGTLYDPRGAPGSPQRRLDGAAVDDASRYFSSPPGTIAYLKLDRGPDHPRAREPVVEGGPGRDDDRSVGFLIDSRAGSAPAARSRNGLEGVTLQRGPFKWGTCVALGSLLDFRMVDVESVDGTFGVGGWNYGASYPITVRDCYLKGREAAYYGYMQILAIQDTTIAYPGRAGIRLVGCNADLRNLLFSEPAKWCEYGIRFHSWGAGGICRVDGLLLDAESNDAPTRALVRFDMNTYSCGDRLSIRNCAFGKLGKGSAAVLLTSKHGRPHERGGVAHLENLAFFHAPKALVEVDDPHGLWWVDVRGCMMPGGLPAKAEIRRRGAGTKVAIEGVPVESPGP